MNPGVSVGTTKPRIAPVPAVRRRVAGPHDGHVGDAAVGDPHLGAVEDPVVAVAARAWCACCDGSLPESGSVRPKQPIASPAAMRGSHSCFCSSDPNFQIGNMASEPCTDTKLRAPLSPASSSRQARP